MSDRIPVTVLSGTLGAGKTTTLNHILTADHSYEIAVLVNDVGEVNVDAEHIERSIDGELVELSNGCICCGLQGELTRSVISLIQDHEFDYLLIEPSGISEPAPVATQFIEGPASSLYHLSSVATVVDARQFYDAFGEGPVERHGPDEHGRPLSDLIVEGVEFCDTLIVNKTDLVSDEEQEQVLETLRTLQPGAEILVTEFGQVTPQELLESDRFTRDIERSARWKQTLEAHEKRESEHNRADSYAHDNHNHDNHDGHVHPPEEYGIESFVYQESRPMHPEKLASFLESVPEELVRAKGWIHVADRETYALELSLAGRESHVTVAGRWIASLPEERQSAYRELHEPHWSDEYGDRETRLVIIGRGLDREQVEQALDSCVLEDTEKYKNPFPNAPGEELRLSVE